MKAQDPAHESLDKIEMRDIYDVVGDRVVVLGKKQFDSFYPRSGRQLHWLKVPREVADHVRLRIAERA